MKYYIFRVKDTLGQEYYILNNQYIGYVGTESCEILSIVENGKNVKKEYQLFAESNYIPNRSEHDRELHTLNCESTRFSHKEILALLETHPVFVRAKDKAWYEVYFPNPNSSASYLKEVGGSKTIKCTTTL